MTAGVPGCVGRVFIKVSGLLQTPPTALTPPQISPSPRPRRAEVGFFGSVEEAGLIVVSLTSHSLLRT